MKMSPAINEQLTYTLREIYSLQKTAVGGGEPLVWSKEEVERCVLATKTKHPSKLRLSRTIPEKSAVLLYELLRSPLSRDKNEQISLTVFLMFLYTHGYWINLPVQELKSLIIWIKTSHNLTQKETIEGARKIILSNIKTIDL